MSSSNNNNNSTFSDYYAQMEAASSDGGGGEKIHINNNDEDDDDDEKSTTARRMMFVLARENNWDELIMKLHSLSPTTIRDAVEDEEEEEEEIQDDDDDDDDGSFSSRRSRSNILHVVFESCKTNYHHQAPESKNNSLLPIEVVQTIINICGKEVINKHDVNEQTPLHIAVQRIPHRTDIIKILVNSNPEVVNQQDDKSQKPIDIICRKIIMLEEYTKYHSSRRPLVVTGSSQHQNNNNNNNSRLPHHQLTAAEVELIHVWDTVKVLAQAQAAAVTTTTAAATSSSSSSCTSNTHNSNNNTKHENNSNDDDDDDEDNDQKQQHNIQQQQPIIIACLMAKDFPFALTDRALKRYKHQLLDEPNNDGNLPLHVVSAMAPPTLSPNKETDNDDNDDDEEEEDNDYLERVLWLCPEAASKRNKQNQTPLMLAINNTIGSHHRKWDTGIFQLLKAHPSGLHDLSIPLQMYPYVLERISGSNNDNIEISSTIIYSILHSRPEIFFGDNDNDNDNDNNNNNNKQSER